jgi:hypothetical protein
VYAEFKILRSVHIKQDERTVTATKEELLAGSHLGVEMVALHQVPAGPNLLLQLTDVTLNK